jgi:Phage portal protein
VAFRSLRLVRDTAALGEALHTTEAPGPLARSIEDAIASARSSMLQRVDIGTALQVPSFTKALKTYTHTIATFPLVERVAGVRETTRPFLQIPDRSTTYWSLMTRTLADILCHDTAWWRVDEVAWDGYPAAVTYLPAHLVTYDPMTDAVWATYDGVPRRISDPSTAGTRVGEVIRFDGDGFGGWLKTMATTLATSASLEAAAMRAAEVPTPSIILKNTGADLPPEQVDQLLEAWELARQSRLTAYLNATIDTHALAGWSPNDLQLTDARNATALMVARAANLDPTWVGAGVPGASLTYSNRVDLYRQLLDLSLSPVMAAVSQRLSLWDITPRGTTVTFDTDEFLRANTLEIGNLIAQQLPLGVIDVPEARTLLDLPEAQ